LIPSTEKSGTTPKLPQPSLHSMCSLLTSVTRDAISMYSLEGGVDGLAYMRLESLLKTVINVLDNHQISGAYMAKGKRMHSIMMQRKRYVEEEACLRQVTASITGDMTKLAEKLLLIAQDGREGQRASSSKREKSVQGEERAYYIRLLLSGKKPRRFQESTTLPTFLEWDTPSICRVPKDIVQEALSSVPINSSRLEAVMCTAFCKFIRDALLQDVDTSRVIFRVGSGENELKDGTKQENNEEATTYIEIGLVQTSCTSPVSEVGLEYNAAIFYNESRHFRYQKSFSIEDGAAVSMIEMTVANSFPCPLSRQRSMLTNEYLAAK